MCGAHLARTHAGLLIAEGEAPDVRFFHADGTEYGKDSEAAQLSNHETVTSALVNMGFREHEAKNALAAVRSRLAPVASVEELLRAALEEATTRSRTARRVACGTSRH